MKELLQVSDWLSGFPIAPKIVSQASLTVCEHIQPSFTNFYSIYLLTYGGD